ncbi:RagB/SusD family nutrient uptake outer membrane protein [Puia sp. P3]|uniref:RagB/SusD family nutrient uptake outer membrane protein n=1 Tax=Puia sp. P3 TaxID=3423952 RepID=UPI003D67606D
MRLLKYKYLIPGLIVAATGAACSHSFLDKTPAGALQSSQLANKAGVSSLLIGAYSMLDGEGAATQGNQYGSGASNWVFGGVVADDAYKGSTGPDQNDITPLQTWTVSQSTSSYLQQKWTALYDGAQRANDVIRTMAIATGISAADHAQLMAEARFLRGFFHFEAKKIWGNVPWVDETISAANKNVNVPNNADIWPKIEADFQFAIDSLAEIPADKGRANKWAAKAYLAKTYMYEHKYDKAKTLLDDLLANGKTSTGAKYDFNPGGYFNNFNPAAGAKNSSESVFSVQMSVNDGSGTNGNYGDVLNFPNDGSGPGGCCGFDNPSINLANAYKTDGGGLPLFNTYNSGNSVSDPNTPYVGNLDPRVDFVMGRPGIPYLDWGPHPGALWVRDGTDGYFSPKKNVYAKSQKGILSSNETSFWGPTQIVANNVNLIRYSDLLLWDAECEVEIGDPAKALTYVNMVRNRVATHPETWTYKNSDFDAGTYTYKTTTTPAATYVISPYPVGAFADKNYAMTAIRFERRLELAMEGQRFFDLQRWNSDPTYPMDMSVVLNNYATVEKTRPSSYSVNPTATFHKGVNELFAIPQNELDLENATGTVILKQNSGYN